MSERVPASSEGIDEDLYAVNPTCAKTKVVIDMLEKILFIDSDMHGHRLPKDEDEAVTLLLAQHQMLADSAQNFREPIDPVAYAEIIVNLRAIRWHLESARTEQHSDVNCLEVTKNTQILISTLMGTDPNDVGQANA